MDPCRNVCCLVSILLLSGARRITSIYQLAAIIARLIGEADPSGVGCPVKPRSRCRRVLEHAAEADAGRRLPDIALVDTGRSLHLRIRRGRDCRGPPAGSRAGSGAGQGRSSRVLRCRLPMGVLWLHRLRTAAACPRSALSPTRGCTAALDPSLWPGPVTTRSAEAGDFSDKL
jgi:hypothetical protein